MKKWIMSLLVGLFLVSGVVYVVAAPAWYECDVKWAGAGGGGVYIVLQNTNFPAFLDTAFPTNVIMVSGGEDATQANRILASALASMSANKKVMVFTEPTSFTEIGGLYIVED